MTKPGPLPPFVAFMVRIPHANRVQLQKIIEIYVGPKAKYLLAAEKDKKNREHFHGIIMCKSDQYDKIQRHFREKWKLSGQAQKDGLKQYGRIRNIKDKNKVLSYTVKDGNVYTSDSWDIDLKPYIAASYPKPTETKKQLREKDIKEYLLNYLVSNQIMVATSNIYMMDDSEFSNYQEICEHICRIYQKYNFDFPTLKTINRSLVRYGILNVAEAVKDHLSRWFRERELKKYEDPLTRKLPDAIMQYYLEK